MNIMFFSLMMILLMLAGWFDISQRCIPNVTHHAHDLMLIARNDTSGQRTDLTDSRRDAFPDRILVRPDPPRQRFVDDRDRRGRGVVVRVERTTTKQRRADRGEIAGVC